jgi:type I restriction enzyme S subunit
MEVKRGYQLCEIGVIPKDWVVCKIRDVCMLINGRGFKPHEWSAQGYPIIRIQNLNGSDEFNRYDGQFDPKILVQSGQLLFAWSGSRGTSFGPHIWQGETALLNYHIWKVLVNEKVVDRNFLFYALSHLTTSIEDQAHGASALVHTQKWEMEAFALAIPVEIAEQRTIAKALGDVDETIEALSRLVAKKRELRQGAMQRLLTGQNRLPGFSSPWHVKRLKELGRFIKGSGVPRDQALSGDLPCVRYGEIYTTHHDVIRQFTSRISRAVAETATPIQFRDLLFACSGETKEEIGKCAAIAENVDAYAGGDIIILRPSAGNPVFLGYLMNTPIVARQKANLGQGDAVVHISAGSLASIEVSLPDEPEQDAIAGILSDMDDELAALEARVAKTQTIKQAMMQVLLTGQVRLPVSADKDQSVEMEAADA